MSDLSFKDWWIFHINLSCDRGYPIPEGAAKAAWDYQQKTIEQLQEKLRIANDALEIMQKRGHYHKPQRRRVLKRHTGLKEMNDEK